MFYNEYFQYSKVEIGECCSYSKNQFKDICRHNTLNEDDTVQKVLLSTHKYICKSLRFGVNNIYKDEKSNKEMILENIIKLISFVKYEIKIDVSVNDSIENCNNLEDLINSYNLNNQLAKANDILDRLREKYPTCESWEENINNKQKFFININGVVCDGIKVLETEQD